MSELRARLHDSMDAVLDGGPIMHFALNTPTGEVVSEMARFAADDDCRRLFWLAPNGGHTDAYVARYGENKMAAPITGSTHGTLAQGCDVTLRFYGHAGKLSTPDRIEHAAALLVRRRVMTTIQIDSMLEAGFGSEVPEHSMFIAYASRWHMNDGRLMYPARTEVVNIRP